MPLFRLTSSSIAFFTSTWGVNTLARTNTYLFEAADGEIRMLKYPRPQLVQATTNRPLLLTMTTSCGSRRRLPWRSAACPGEALADACCWTRLLTTLVGIKAVFFVCMMQKVQPHIYLDNRQSTTLQTGSVPHWTRINVRYSNFPRDTSSV